jgi:hypothetical protein
MHYRYKTEEWPPVETADEDAKVAKGATTKSLAEFLQQQDFAGWELRCEHRATSEKGRDLLVFRKPAPEAEMIAKYVASKDKIQESKQVSTQAAWNEAAKLFEAVPGCTVTRTAGKVIIKILDDWPIAVTWQEDGVRVGPANLSKSPEKIEMEKPGATGATPLAILVSAVLECSRKESH